MKKKPKKPVKSPRKKPARKPIAGSELIKDALHIHEEVANLKQDVEGLTEGESSVQERLQDLEIHVNLLTRLLTTLCIDKFGMRVGVLKRLIKRIEKEAIRDSQILQLESLYNMNAQQDAKKKKGKNSKSSSRDDPWDDLA